MKGIIKKIVLGKPFGFITVEGQANDVFFHQDQAGGEAVFATLKEGDAVTFETKTEERNGEMKTSAVNVQKVA